MRFACPQPEAPSAFSRIEHPGAAMRFGDVETYCFAGSGLRRPAGPGVPSSTLVQDYFICHC